MRALPPVQGLRTTCIAFDPCLCAVAHTAGQAGRARGVCAESGRRWDRWRRLEKKATQLDLMLGLLASSGDLTEQVGEIDSPIDSPVASPVLAPLASHALPGLDLAASVPALGGCGDQGHSIESPLLDRRQALRHEKALLDHVGQALANAETNHTRPTRPAQPHDRPGTLAESPRRPHDWTSRGSDDPVGPAPGSPSLESKRGYRQLGAERRLQRDIRRYEDSLPPITKLGRRVYFWLFPAKKDTLRPPPSTSPRALPRSLSATASPHRLSSPIPLPPQHSIPSSAPQPTAQANTPRADVEMGPGVGEQLAQEGGNFLRVGSDALSSASSETTLGESSEDASGHSRRTSASLPEFAQASSEDSSGRSRRSQGVCRGAGSAGGRTEDLDALLAELDSYEDVRDVDQDPDHVNKQKGVLDTEEKRVVPALHLERLHLERLPRQPPQFLQSERGLGEAAERMRLLWRPGGWRTAREPFAGTHVHVCVCVCVCVCVHDAHA